MTSKYLLIMKSPINLIKVLWLLLYIIEFRNHSCALRLIIFTRPTGQPNVGSIPTEETTVENQSLCFDYKI